VVTTALDDATVGGKICRMKRYWRIRGYDSSKTIFEIKVGLGQFTEAQIKHLLRALTAKAGLTLDEMVGAYANRKTTIANNLLTVHKDSNYPTYWCGGDPHFTASVVDENGRIHRQPALSV
jgi:hypothetical protein